MSVLDPGGYLVMIQDKLAITTIPTKFFTYMVNQPVPLYFFFLAFYNTRYFNIEHCGNYLAIVFGIQMVSVTILGCSLKMLTDEQKAALTYPIQ
jgi:hypothetical protein